MTTYPPGQSTRSVDVAYTAHDLGCNEEEATVISKHRTSQGVVRYRRWPCGCMSVELLDGLTEVLAWVPRRAHASWRDRGVAHYASRPKGPVEG